MENLTDNEKMVLKALVENAQSEGGVEFIIDDVADNLGKSKRSLAGTLASLQNKGVIDCFGNSCYYDGQVRAQAIEWYNNNF
jgi:Mn-dependent DtxR family transcriptional regulator